MAKLDGKTPITPVPFDAHEQIIRGHHEVTKQGDHVAKEYEHQEYPKTKYFKKEDGTVGEAMVKSAAQERSLKPEHFDFSDLTNKKPKFERSED